MPLLRHLRRKADRKRFARTAGGLASLSLSCRRGSCLLGSQPYQESGEVRGAEQGSLAEFDAPQFTGANGYVDSSPKLAGSHQLQQGHWRLASPRDPSRGALRGRQRSQPAQCLVRGAIPSNVSANRINVEWLLIQRKQVKLKCADSLDIER
jgi:hypothetical protein